MITVSEVTETKDAAELCRANFAWAALANTVARVKRARTVAKCLLVVCGGRQAGNQLKIDWLEAVHASAARSC